jgi:hypothetical protein
MNGSERLLVMMFDIVHCLSTGKAFGLSSRKREYSQSSVRLNSRKFLIIGSCERQ